MAHYLNVSVKDVTDGATELYHDVMTSGDFPTEYNDPRLASRHPGDRWPPISEAEMKKMLLECEICAKQQIADELAHNPNFLEEQKQRMDAWTKRITDSQKLVKQLSALAKTWEQLGFAFSLEKRCGWSR